MKYSRKVQLNSNTGLVGRKAQARIDLEKNQYALRECENMLLTPEGVCVKRPGTLYVDNTASDNLAVGHPFQADITTGFSAVFTHERIDVYSDGGTTPLSSITSSPYVEGDLRDLQVRQVRDVAIITHQDYAPRALVRLSDTDFQLRAIVYDLPAFRNENVHPVMITPSAPAWATTTPYFVGNHVLESGVTYECVTKHTAGTFSTDLAAVKWVVTTSLGAGTSCILTASTAAWGTGVPYVQGNYKQNGTNIYICLSDHTSGTFSTDLASGLWEAIDVFTSSNVAGHFRLGHRREATTIELQMTNSSGVIVAGNTTSGNFSGGGGHIGNVFEILNRTNQNTVTGTDNFSPSSSTIESVGDVRFRTTGIWGGTIKLMAYNENTLTFEAVREWKSNGDDNKDEIITFDKETKLRLDYTHATQTANSGNMESYAYLEVSDAYSYGYAKVTAYTSAVAVTATVINGFNDTSSTDVWSEGSWSARRGFPRTCDIFEQRIYYAANKDQKQTVWASVIGDFFNFNYGSGEDDRAFTQEVPSNEENPIEWLIGQKVVLLGNGKDYGALSSGSDDEPMSAKLSNYRVQEGLGFSGIKPEIIGSALLAVERNGRRLHEIRFAFDAGTAGGFVSRNVNRLNEELCESGIIDIDYQQLREPYIYCVLANGEMAVLHYNTQDNVIGWSKFTTSGEYESVWVLRGTDNDVVYCTVKRVINGATVRFIEKFNPVTWSAQEDAYFVDAGVQYSGISATSATGLGHLNGATCKTWLNGGTGDDVVPSGGAATIDASTSYAVGLGFSPRWKPLRLDYDAASGGTQGRQKRIAEVDIDFIDSHSVLFEQNDGDTSVIKIRTNSDVMDKPYDMASGYYRFDINPTHSEDYDRNDPFVVITQTAPAPLTIASLIIEYGIE